jgi:hypothetical protein
MSTYVPANQGFRFSWSNPLDNASYAQEHKTELWSNVFENMGV